MANGDLGVGGSGGWGLLWEAWEDGPDLRSGLRTITTHEFHSSPNNDDDD